MSSVEIDKTLLAFLNGLCRRQYFGEGQFTDEFLKEEVLGELDDAGFANILKKFQSIMVTLVSADMDYSQLDAFLTSQMKKRQAPLSDVEAATIRRFWKNQKHKIHNELVKKSTNDSHVKALSWRVDVQNKGRFIDEINRGTAIVELKLGAATTDEVSGTFWNAIIIGANFAKLYFYKQVYPNRLI
jgi:hypothetical protein